MAADPAVLTALRADPTMTPLRRSFEVYYGNPAHEAAMDALYAQFVAPGDLVFDIGAHIGDRIGSFRRLGARVVALEPQPLCCRAIRAIYAGDDRVRLLEAACSAEPGTVELHVNSANPTVSSASVEFVRAADGAGGWEGQVWDTELEGPCTTLDSLISEHGVPSFTKIDVEGFEATVLAGLHTALPALSFEFTTIARDVARQSLERLALLGTYRFNVSLGESQTMTFPDWVAEPELVAHLEGLPHAANSGDIYCVLATHPDLADLTRSG